MPEIRQRFRIFPPLEFEKGGRLIGRILIDRHPAGAFPPTLGENSHRIRDPRERLISPAGFHPRFFHKLDGGIPVAQLSVKISGGGE